VSRNAVDALIEEWDRARRELVALLPRVRDAELQAGEPLDESRPRGILIHVLRAVYGYATWIREVLGLPKIARSSDPKSLAGCEAFQRAFEELRDYFVRALEPLTDVDIDGPGQGQPPPHFKSRWGEDYGIEQMLEHAICHHLRHRRQLERMQIFEG
jgi:hypothetical protein